jgi:hypothetical protein
MGTNKRYAAHYDQLTNDKMLERMMAENSPTSLTNEELELDQQPLTRTPTPQPVTAWFAMVIPRSRLTASSSPGRHALSQCAGQPPEGNIERGYGRLLHALDENGIGRGHWIQLTAASPILIPSATLDGTSTFVSLEPLDPKLGRMLKMAQMKRTQVPTTIGTERRWPMLPRHSLPPVVADHRDVSA